MGSHLRGGEGSHVVWSQRRFLAQRRVLPEGAGRSAGLCHRAVGGWGMAGAWPQGLREWGAGGRDRETGECLSMAPLPPRPRASQKEPELSSGCARCLCRDSVLVLLQRTEDTSRGPSP